MFLNHFQQLLPYQDFLGKNKVPKVKPSVDLDLPRIVHYPADYSGCGLYRMSWPGHLLNAHGKALVQESTAMVLDANWYKNVKVVRIQRQAAPHQKQFINFLTDIKSQLGFKVVYEIDDVPFREDIPDYNGGKDPFTSDEIRENIQQIMLMSDEITVTNPYMRDYFRQKLGKQEVTVIPNFVPRWWIGNYFNQQKVNKNFDQYRKRPRVLYAGSAAHSDINGRTKFKDDFEHVYKYIVDTRKEFQWVFIGTYPLLLRKYIQSKEFEFYPWQKYYDYPELVSKLDIQMMVAPLQDNIFNRCKSDIKYIEACMFGLPIACQDIVTYKDAPIKFKTGEEMIDCLRATLKNSKSYRDDVLLRRSVAEDRFLELDKNIDCYVEAAIYPYGDPKRINLRRYNNEI